MVSCTSGNISNPANTDIIFIKSPPNCVALDIDRGGYKNYSIYVTYRDTLTNQLFSKKYSCEKPSSFFTDVIVK